jgi:tetratricopeptide (TPR) repeat protein
VHRRCRQAALIVAGIAFLVFLPSVTSTFIYDDIQLIVKNEYVHALEWLPRAFKTHFWDVAALAKQGDFNAGVEASRRYYRPLVTVSFLLTWVVAGGRAWVFHLTNVAVHAVTAGLATRAAIRWTRSLPLGVLVGLVFALHPTRTENVVWIAGRSDILMLLFMLLSLEAFRRFERAGSWVAFGGGLAALVAATISKEPALLTPLLLLARDRGKPQRTALAVTGALGALYGIARFTFWRSESGGHTFAPLTFLHTVGSYAHRTLAPWPPTMYFDEVSYDAAGNPEFQWPLLLLGALAILAVVAALVIAWRRSRTAFWLLAMAVCMMAPIVNLFGSVIKAAVQDRFLYAPLLFAAAAAARLLRERLRAAVRNRAFVLATAGVALGAIAMVELRIPDYRSEDAFWEAELAHHPDDPRALHMLGQNAASRGDLKLAFANFQRASGLRHRQDVLFIMSHFEEASVLGALLPDGRVAELLAIRDELWRVVEPTVVPAPAEIQGFVVGGPLPAKALQEQHELTSFYWEAALIATRTGDFRRADVAARATNVARAATQPLNSALVLARIGRVQDAKALIAKVRETTSFQDLASANEYTALTARLDRAEQLAAARDAASSDGERAALEAVRLAGLGAYWSALRVLVQASLTDTEDTTTLTLQLLVACRFERAAGEFAAQHDSAALLRKIESELPPSLRETEPVPTPLDRVRSLAKRPL